MEYMTLALSVIAIVLGLLALLPYILEAFFRSRWAPKFKVTVNKIIVKQVNVSPPVTEVNFDISWGLNRGKPFFLDSVVLILPASAELSPTELIHPNGSEMRCGLYIEGGEWPPRIAVTLESNQSESWYSDVTSAYHVGFKIPNTETVPLNLRWRVEIDTAKLSVWSIFYHAQKYVVFKHFNVNLTRPEPQDYE